MFKITPKPTFEATVKIPVPGEKSADLKLIFKHKNRDAVNDFFDRAAKSTESDGVVLSEIVAGWKDVDTEFSPDALTEVCQNYHGAVPAIFESYCNELRTARTKN